MNGGEHAHGEEFPRAETAELVGGALAAETRRWRIQVALVSAGVTALVLGLPTASLASIRMEQIWPTALGEWTGLHLVPAVVARALTAVTEMRPYQAWYLVSALSLGCTTAILLGVAHRRGTTPLRAIFLTLLAISTPMAWLAATIPNTASSELLGAAWLFSALDRDRDERWTTRATVAWIGSALLHAWNLYLWPAYALALWKQRRASLVVASVALVALPLIVLGAWQLEHGGLNRSSFFAISSHTMLGSSWRVMLASGSGGWGPMLAWWVVWPIGLGVGTFGILRLLRSWFHAPRRRGPGWMVAFALFPLAVLGLGGFIGYDVPWLWLVPIAFAGLLEGTFLPAWILVALSLLGIVSLRALGRGDASADWHNLAVMRLLPDDFVIAASLHHSNQLSGLRVDHRDIDLLGLGSTQAPTWSEALEAAARARAAGRRVILDVAEPHHADGDWIRLEGPEVEDLRRLGALDLDAPGL